MNLDEGDIELEVDLRGGDCKGAAGVVKGGFHSCDVLILFAFQEVDAAETCKDLRVGGTVFVEGSFVLKWWC